jgi:hypothetical protein
MLRIGVMLDSYTSSAWVAGILESIRTSDFAQIDLVVLNTSVPPRKPDFRTRLRNHWNGTLYRMYERWDYKRNKVKDDALASTDISSMLKDVPCIQVHPMRKGFTDRIPEDELALIAAYNLDVLFRFGFRIIRGGILRAARSGVWSFHHDDNLEYRGGPPLFWEIYERNPISGTILQILTDSLDGGRVIYRGHGSTHFKSLYQNRNPNYWKTAEYAMRRLSDLHMHGFKFLESLDTYNEQTVYQRGVYRTPNTLKMINFAARLLADRIGTRIRAKFFSSGRQWFLAYRRRTEARRFDDSTGYQLVVPTTDRFYADPFLVERDGRTFLFFEDFRYAENRALISCLEIAADGTAGPVREVLRCPYHLSYPFLFEHDGELYMIPESKENMSVKLYRATQFPYEWELESVLLENVFAVDATIHHANGKFWMFAGVSNGKYSNCDELSIFFAEDLKGPWKPHPRNPIITDVRRARPAGALFFDQGRLIRPSQDCGKDYGYAIVFSEVLKLNESEYEERPISKITPDWMARNLCTHTYSCSERFEVIDGNRRINIG